MNQVRRRRHPVTVHITAEERDLLIAHASPDSNLSQAFRGARIVGPLVCLDLEDDGLDAFLDEFEATANSAQNDSAMERLGWALARIEAGFAGKADPGWHLLRPAIVRLDMSPKQGQYLAFIHAYTQVHRRAPTESEIQD